MSETTTLPPATDQHPETEPERSPAQDQPEEKTEKRRDGRPSQRDRTIYERHVLRGETQEAIAADHGFSRQRVGQICRQVERWVATHPDDELAAALRVRCQRRFDVLYCDAFQQFQRSKQDLVVERERTSHRLPDGNPEKGVTTTVRERVKRQQNGDARFLNTALRAVERMERTLIECAGRKASRSSNADQMGDAECGMRNEATKGRANEAPKEKPWWIKNDPVGGRAPVIRRESVPPAPPAPVVRHESVSARDGESAGVRSVSVSLAPPVPLAPSESITERSDDGATELSDTAMRQSDEDAKAREGEGANVTVDQQPAKSDIPHSALHTPHSSTTPHSKTSKPPRDTMLIVGAPKEVPAMARFARDKFTGYHIEVRTSLVGVVDALQKDLDSIALISLDDDMGGSRVELGELLEPGTMAEVAREIIKHQPCCPVVLNTSGEEAKRLSQILMLARWNTYWAKPSGGDWLKQDWLYAVKRALRDAKPRARKRRKAGWS